MPWSVLAVGDSYLPVDLLRSRLEGSRALGATTYIQIDPSARPRLDGVSEYQGSPDQIIDAAGGAEVLLVHAAPVTVEVLDACPSIRVIACVRGNPINVDTVAARERGVTVLHTPAKNADAVADLTMVFAHLLFRRVPEALSWLDAEARRGEQLLDSTFVGGRFMAREPRGATMGIVGFGAIGRRVAAQAEHYGMEVLVHDPFVTDDPRLVGLDELFERSDVVTLHAKATAETRHLLGTAAFDRMRPGALVVNTARQSLVDEHAMLEALESGRVAGAALDVCEPEGLWPVLVQHPRVMVTPHLGGATAQTQERGIDMIIEDLVRIGEGERPRHAIAGGVPTTDGGR